MKRRRERRWIIPDKFRGMVMTRQEAGGQPEGCVQTTNDFAEAREVLTKMRGGPMMKCCKEAPRCKHFREGSL